MTISTQSKSDICQEIFAKLQERFESRAKEGDKKTWILGKNFEKDFDGTLSKIMSEDDWKYLSENPERISYAADKISELLRPVDMGFGVSQNAKRFFRSESVDAMNMGFRVGEVTNRVPVLALFSNATTMIGSTAGVLVSGIAKTLLMPANAVKSYNKVEADEFYYDGRAPSNFLPNLKKMIEKEKELIGDGEKTVLRDFVKTELTKNKFCINRVFPTLVPLYTQLYSSQVEEILSADLEKYMTVDYTQVSGVAFEIQRGRGRFLPSTLALSAAEAGAGQPLIKSGSMLAALFTSVCRNKCLEKEGPVAVEDVSVGGVSKESAKEAVVTRESGGLDGIKPQSAETLITSTKSQQL